MHFVQKTMTALLNYSQGALSAKMAEPYKILKPIPVIDIPYHMLRKGKKNLWRNLYPWTVARQPTFNEISQSSSCKSWGPESPICPHKAFPSVWQDGERLGDWRRAAWIRIEHWYCHHAVNTSTSRTLHHCTFFIQSDTQRAACVPRLVLKSPEEPSKKARQHQIEAVRLPAFKKNFFRIDQICLVYFFPTAFSEDTRGEET